MICWNINLCFLPVACFPLPLLGRYLPAEPMPCLKVGLCWGCRKQKNEYRQWLFLAFMFQRVTDLLERIILGQWEGSECPSEQKASWLEGRQLWVENPASWKRSCLEAELQKAIAKESGHRQKAPALTTISLGNFGVARPQRVTQPACYASAGQGWRPVTFASTMSGS